MRWWWWHKLWCLPPRRREERGLCTYCSCMVETSFNFKFNEHFNLINVFNFLFLGFDLFVWIIVEFNTGSVKGAQSRQGGYIIENCRRTMNQVFNWDFYATTTTTKD